MQCPWRPEALGPLVAGVTGSSESLSVDAGIELRSRRPGSALGAISPLPVSSFPSRDHTVPTPVFPSTRQNPSPRGFLLWSIQDPHTDKTIAERFHFTPSVWEIFIFPGEGMASVQSSAFVSLSFVIIIICY